MVTPFRGLFCAQPFYLQGISFQLPEPSVRLSLFASFWSRATRYGELNGIYVSITGMPHKEWICAWLCLLNSLLYRFDCKSWALTRLFQLASLRNGIIPHVRDENIPTTVRFQSTMAFLSSISFTAWESRFNCSPLTTQTLIHYAISCGEYKQFSL